jgi:TPR repeat protein
MIDSFPRKSVSENLLMRTVFFKNFTTLCPHSKFSESKVVFSEAEGGVGVIKRSLCIALIFVFLATPSWASFDEGKAAYDRHEYVASLKIFMPLAEKGNPKAQAIIGVMYFKGQGVPRNDTQAAVWSRKAAMQGDAKGQNFLGFLYYYGHGLKKDRVMAVYWYEKAADQGNSDAQYALGTVYEKGWGTPLNYTKSARWYSKAAEQGNVLAQVSLGAMYKEGRGVSRDYVEAYKWFTIANFSGFTLGKMHRERLAKKMNAPDISKAKNSANIWYMNFNNKKKNK